jgi:hypothetical protein
MELEEPLRLLLEGEFSQVDFGTKKERVLKCWKILFSITGPFVIVRIYEIPE